MNSFPLKTELGQRTHFIAFIFQANLTNVHGVWFMVYDIHEKEIDEMKRLCFLSFYIIAIICVMCIWFVC